MALLDWIVLIGLSGLCVVVGLWFTRKAGAGGEEGYFTANRSLSWFSIGISNASTYQSGLGAFVTLIFAGGLRGNWLWWPSWVIWMPLVAIIWARMWRRMEIVTTAELISLRYEGKPALWARRAYSLAMVAFAVILIGYMIGFFAKTIRPVVQLETWQIILLFGIPALIYTLLGGLLSSVKVAVVQFGIMMVSSFILWWMATRQYGGWSSILEQAVQMRPDALDMNPVHPEHYPLATLVMFIILGVFFAGSPTAGEGMTAQRFMAAKNERHAIGGQLFNAFISLSLRIVPLIGLGIAAVALFSPADPDVAGFSTSSEGIAAINDPALAWGTLITVTALPAGFVGLLIASEAAAFMSTLSALVNWGSSFLINDFYLAWRPNATHKQQILMSRFTGFAIFAFAGGLALAFVEDMVSWFLFINSVMVIFWLPLAYFRFFWARFNVWGELAATVLGLPLAIIVWFILGFQDKPFWQGTGLLFITAIISQIIITLLTRPEPAARQELFFRKCRPLFGWKTFRNTLVLPPTNDPSLRNLIFASLFGILACLGLVVATNAMMVYQWLLFIIAAVVTAVGALGMVAFVKSPRRTPPRTSEPFSSSDHR